MEDEKKDYFMAEAERWAAWCDNPQYPFYAQKEMGNALREFRIFVDAYLKYFKNNRPPIPLPLFEEWKKNVCLEYWVPLSMVAAQYQVTEYRRRLNRVSRDIFTQLIEKAQDKWKIEISDSDVLLYISKRPISYFYPYTNRSFIALSWIDDEIMEQSDQNLINSDKVMALPHEAAHHIYWNSDFGRKPDVERDILNSRLDLSDIAEEKLTIDFPDISQEQKDAVGVTIQGWAEEIFADVVGTLISNDGKLFALSAQNLVKEYCLDRADMVFNDKIHPSPLLRPLVSAYALELCGETAPQTPVIPAEYTVDVEVNNSILPVKIGYLKRALELAVDEIYAIVKDQKIKKAEPENRISNFEELKAFAEQEKSVHGTEIYDTLLSPLIFERASVSGTCNNCHKYVTAKCPKCGR
jgi:hypothetical protein